MGKFSCFSLRRILKSRRKKKKDKADDASSTAVKQMKEVKVKIENPEQPFKSGELKTTTYVEDSICNAKVIIPKSPVGCEALEIAYEGEDEHEENALHRRNFSDFDFQAHVITPGEEFDFITKMETSSDSYDAEAKEVFINQEEKDDDMIRSGHISDSGIGKAEFRAFPSLKRSCSYLETKRKVLKKVADQLPPKSQSFEELQELTARVRDDFNAGSPASVMTRCSADRVMLKKHSSSQVLPSRSRRLWWKLFLWSHRNLHKFWKTKPKPRSLTVTLNQQGGYSSDTVEPHRAFKVSNRETLNRDDNQSWKGFHNGVTTSLCSQNQWVAFPSSSSPFKRVDEWVRILKVETPQPAYDMNDEEGTTCKSPERNTHHLNLSEEMLHANNVIQTLNSSSAVAHISGISLKAIPMISAFSSLRSVNLSNNFIVQITPGSLPKGLHTLNLSRNKINNIEGLRELTRLRVVDLSYNRIARIVHGLSNCTLIKELYLAGNKISDAEGLHRLLKLTVLDLSFNKILTTKALGQLVANYNSLQALNLLGNPVLGNNSDEQLRKAVCSLLPKIRYLNKQPIKPQRAREVLTDSVAKAALGSGSWSSRRKAAKRVSKSGSFSIVNKNSVAIEKNKNKLKSRSHHN